MRHRFALLAFVVPIFLTPFSAVAQWALDGAPVCTAPNFQDSPRVIPDGAGGAIVTWADSRSGSGDIYAQRVNASGVPQWTANGVALCTDINGQYNPRIIQDAAGGAIVVWEDSRNGNNDIYAQRVNAAGVPQWTANGVVVCTAVNPQYSPMITSDGAGGAIVTWYDYRSGVSFDIYVQRLNASGAAQWTANGVALCSATNDQQSPTIVSDGAGGAIVAWHDVRSGGFDIYARRVNASGTPQWTADGVALCTAVNAQLNTTLVTDGAGGAIVAWLDFRVSSSDVYVRRVNASGVPQWAADGVALCIAGGTQDSPAMIADGTGGAFVTWNDARGGAFVDIYARRVNASGDALWFSDGVAICAAAQDQYYPTIATDGAGGAIIAWQDSRNGLAQDIYAQRITPAGVPQWVGDGVAVSTAGLPQANPSIAADGAGGAVIAWQDYRPGGPNTDIYAQRVDATHGYWGHPEPIVASAADIKRDQGGKVAVNWTASGRDLIAPRTISHYTIWRAIDVAPMDQIVGAPAVLKDISRVGLDATGPVYASLSPTSSYYWELVGTQSAHGWPAYSFSAPTRADSVLGNTATEYFMVAAHYQYDDYVAFASNVVSGHSVDNLAPAAPLSLTAQRIGNYVYLKWNRVHVPDLRDYSVYRKTSTGVTPVPINFLSTADDTVLTDSSAPNVALFYIVTAYDVHANQSAPSNEASVSASTGAGNTPSITALALLDNVPNPFAGTTTLRVGLPKTSEVEIQVFDVAGRRVRHERTSPLAAGWRDVAFDGRDDAGRVLPSGVYFYRIAAAGSTITKKMVIAR